jgi:putative transposase
MMLVDQLGDRFGVEPVLRVLEVPVSTFYGWVARRRRPSPRAIEEVWLSEQIERIHADSDGTYGSPKVHAQLRRQGIRVSRKRVERLMRQVGLQGAFLRKRKRSSTRRDPAATPAPDLVNRNFKTDAPDRLWVADISRIPTGEGPLWLASVRDAFSRRVVGWKVSDRADTELVLGVLEYALWSRQVERDRLVFHSDHGAQYTAIRFTQRLIDAGARPSMGSVGDSYDNALAENFLLQPEGGAHLPHQLPHQRRGGA